jgi:uncharacterized protein YeaO (DUF488 family)
VEKFPEFRQRYIAELSSKKKSAELRRIAGLAKHGTVTLVYGAKDVKHNNAVVLAGIIADMAKDKPT